MLQENKKEQSLTLRSLQSYCICALLFRNIETTIWSLPIGSWRQLQVVQYWFWLNQQIHSREKQVSHAE